MRRAAAAAAGIGVVFGLALSWSGMTNPDVLRDGLLFRDSYLYLFFAGALATSAVGLRLLRRANARGVLTGDPIAWSTERPQRRHLAGSALFGVGWAVADACPGPVAAQLGQGILWGLPTAAGIAIGVWLYLRRDEAQAGTRRRDAIPRVAPERALTPPSPAGARIEG